MLSRLVSEAGLLFLRALALLPYGLIAGLGDVLGYLAFQVPSSRKRIMLTNLKLCFPEWSEEQRYRVAQRACRHAVRSYVERSVQWFGSTEKLLSLIEVESEIDLTTPPGRPGGQPAIFLGFHFVGIEAGSLWYSRLGPSASLYTPMSNPYVDRAAKAARARFGAEMASRGGSARAVLRMFRENKTVMLAADMDYGIRNSVFVPFFGVQACTLNSVARLAQTGHAVVIPFVVEVLPRYRGYRLKIFKPWDNYPTGNDEADARHMNAVLEAHIRRMPEQYYWVHRRFKTRPPGEPSVY
jgi:KDO2-lipid IV(A) lauroyltransferase